MKPVKFKSYTYTVRPFMRKLGISGNSLVVFASLYSFTKGEYGAYFGSQAYLAAAIGISERNLSFCLKKLREMNLIEKRRAKNGRLGYATLVDDDAENYRYKPLTEEDVNNRLYKVKYLGRKNLVKVSMQQHDELFKLIDIDIVVEYVRKLENLIEEAKANKTPVPHSHYHTIRKWIIEDYGLGEVSELQAEDKQKSPLAQREPVKLS